jgi:cell division protein FtsW
MMQDVKLWFDRNLKGDPIIWGIVIILSVISIVVVYSATGSLAFKYTGGNTEKYLIDHSIMVLAGLLVMWVAHKIPYRTFGLIGKFLLVISIPLLFFTYVFGSTVNEANRWLTIPVINKAFQPSDIAKLALIATLASLLARNQKNISDFRNAFLPMMVVIGLVCGLIGLANMSTAVLLLTTCLLLLLIGRVPVKYIMMVVLVGSLFLTSSILIGQRGSTFFSRIENFVSGDELPFQAEQSFIAISTGAV